MKGRLMVLAVAVAAGCSVDTPPPKAKAPPREPLGFTVVWENPQVLRVTGRAEGKYQLAPLHCAAARRALTDGADTLEWIGGVAKEVRDGYEAVFVYEAVGADPAKIDLSNASGETVALSDSGGGAPVDGWLKYCDAANAADEDEA